jgi:2'-5' RNA ligase
MVRFKPILNVGTQIPDRSHCLDRELLDVDDVQPSQLADVSSDLRFASSLVEEPAKFQSTSSAVLCVEDKIVTESETKGIVKSESIKTEAETTSGNLCKPVGEEIKQGEEKCVEGALMSQAASLEGDQSTKPDKKSKPKRDSPDAFVAVRISSPFIRGSLELIQKSLVEKNKKLKHALVSLDKLHITMMVIKLGVDEERIEKAKLALEEAARRVSVFLTSEKQSGPAPLTLVFKGVSSFSDQVLFASLDKTNELMMSQFTAVADIVRKTFHEAGIPSTDQRTFNPHLTIVKLNQLSPKQDARLSPQDYEEFADTYHGDAEIRELELLSMSRRHPPADDGYYFAFSRSNWV